MSSTVPQTIPVKQRQNENVTNIGQSDLANLPTEPKSMKDNNVKPNQSKNKPNNIQNPQNQPQGKQSKGNNNCKQSNTDINNNKASNNKQNTTNQGKLNKGKPKIANREGFARLSYLHQLSHTFATIDKLTPLSNAYSKTLDLTAKKAVLKLDPQIKRSFCKKCHAVQIPGLNVSLRITDEGKRSECYEMRCECGLVKRYPIGKDYDYVLFTEKEAHFSENV